MDAVSSTVSAESMSANAVGESSLGWLRSNRLPLLLTLILLGLSQVPRIRGNPNLAGSIVGVGVALLAWQMVLHVVARRRQWALRVEFVPVQSHYVQALVQFSIIVWWGLFWRDVYAMAPLILAQLLFVYVIEALFSWSRGRTWRLGFGPFPIVLSTNLLLWFKDDWFYLQFLMLLTGALGKQFLTWNREGRRCHIFNPSAFGQFVFALALIATGTTNDLTWGRQIAATFETPHMLIVIFLGGLVVQYLFHVTLMTLSATAALCAVNLIYTEITGVYYFVNINIAAPIFLGMHLLVTDPATSPRTNLGRVIFGGVYGLAYAALFHLLAYYEVPIFWDKLLPVPILNLCVPLIDRLARGPILGGLTRAWDSLMAPRPLNLLHMACWGGLFSTMLFTGFIESPHPGVPIAFWKKALAEGKPFAGQSLVMAAGALAEAGGSAAACNELGLICMEGEIVRENHGQAAHYFSRACELGDEAGCANVAMQFLFLHERRSDEDVKRALDRLEQSCGPGRGEMGCFLTGLAYETGRGRPKDLVRAKALYRNCRMENLYAWKGIARIRLSDETASGNLGMAVQAFQKACESGDAESCWYAAYIFDQANGVERDAALARRLLEQACGLGLAQACAALEQPALPPFSNPQPMAAPGWASGIGDVGPN